jgi:hypothetical protein
MSNLATPIEGLPDLVAQYPEKPIRLTLDPFQAVTLWSFVNEYCQVTPTLEGHTEQDRFFLSVMESIEEALSERLTFRPRGGVQ